MLYFIISQGGTKETFSVFLTSSSLKYHVSFLIKKGHSSSRTCSLKLNSSFPDCWSYRTIGQGRFRALLQNIQYCAIETCRKFPRWEFLWNSFPSSFLFFPVWRKLISPPGNFVSPLGKHNSPIFSQFPANFSRILPEFPRFPNDSYLSLLFPPVSCAVFNTTSQLYIVSEHPTSILCILHVSRGFHIMRDKELYIWGILRKFSGIQGNSGKSDENLFMFFQSFSQVWNTVPSWGNLIPLVSPLANVKTGENSFEKSEREFPSPPTSFNCTVGLLRYCSLC